jgi:hypothetical protein
MLGIHPILFGSGVVFGTKWTRDVMDFNLGFYFSASELSNSASEKNLGGGGWRSGDSRIRVKPGLLDDDDVG